MSSGTIVVVIVLVILVIAAAATLAMTARRRRLQRQFGPEYDRVVSEQDSQLRAEAELTQRQRRVRKLNIRPLPEAARRQHLAEWQTIQEEFVDSPQSAVTEAYTLVTTVMQERGYPTEDDEQVMADLSVDHARMVGNFRDAQTVTREVAHGSVATEEMRQALIKYRELFADLLGDGPEANGAWSPRHAATADPDLGTGQPETPDAAIGAVTVIEPDETAITSPSRDSDV
jgi:hypothetical protein